MIENAVSTVAQLGGYQGKGSEKPPGFEVIKRGLICLEYMVRGYQIGVNESPSMKEFSQPFIQFNLDTYPLPGIQIAVESCPVKLMG
jgi:hypothetical protein